MTSDAILAKLRSILTGPEFLVEEEQITTKANLKEDLGLDDLDVVEFVTRIEKEFFKGEEIPAEVVDVWATIGDVVDGILEGVEVE